MLATALAGLFSMSAAALVAVALPARALKRMLGLSLGLMLATSLLHSLPEAFESGADARSLLATILGGLFGFFLLEKLHGDHQGHGRAGAGWMILVGDGMHNFCDGILIAAAFLADPKLGMVTGLAIVTHEIPLRIGDFLLLLNKGNSRTRAIVLNLPSMLLAVAGALAGTLALERASSLVPYVLAFSSAGFLYIALSDLIPRLQRDATWRESGAQVVLIAAGIGIVCWLTAGHHS